MLRFFLLFLVILSGLFAAELTPPGQALVTPWTATLARLIDQGVLAMGYLWLCCGVLALVGVGGALIWFLRRSRRG